MLWAVAFDSPFTMKQINELAHDSKSLLDAVLISEHYNIKLENVKSPYILTDFNKEV